MKQLEFTTQINASKKKVWEIMLQPKTYMEWVSASWPGSYYKGVWAQGENIKFLSSEGGGTLATIAEYKPYDDILANHIAVIKSDGTEDRDSDASKGWIGTTERYAFTENNGKTTVTIKIETSPEWEAMFNDGWPDALAKLKEISER